MYRSCGPLVGYRHSATVQKDGLRNPSQCHLSRSFSKTELRIFGVEAHLFWYWLRYKSWKSSSSCSIDQFPETNRNRRGTSCEKDPPQNGRPIRSRTCSGSHAKCIVWPRYSRYPELSSSHFLLSCAQRLHPAHGFRLFYVPVFI
jgi:hypothetical protein